MKTEYSLKEVNVMLDKLRFYINDVRMDLQDINYETENPNGDKYVNQVVRIERHIWKLQERLNGLDKAKEYNIV